MNIKKIDGNTRNDPIFDKIRALFSKVTQMKPPAMKQSNHDQKKDGSCSTFASGGSATFNTGIVWSDMYLAEWSKNNKYDTVGPLARVSREFATSHGLTCVQFFVDSEEAQYILNAGYALAISCNIPISALKQGLTTGKISGKHTGKTMQHAMFIYKQGGHYYLCNSWAELARKNDGYFNHYEVNFTELKLYNYVRGLASIIF